MYQILLVYVVVIRHNITIHELVSLGNPNYIKTSQNNIYMAIPNINDLDCSHRSSKFIFIIYSSVMVV